MLDKNHSKKEIDGSLFYRIFETLNLPDHIDFSQLDRKINNLKQEEDLDNNLKLSIEDNSIIKIEIKNLFIPSIDRNISWNFLGEIINHENKSFLIELSNIEIVESEGRNFSIFIRANDRLQTRKLAKINILNSSFGNNNLTINQFSDVSLISVKKIHSLSLSETRGSLTMKGVGIHDIQFSQLHSHVNIKSGEFTEFNLSNLEAKRASDLRTLSFDDKSSIKFRAYEAYKALRVVSEGLNDKIQSLIFYKKELDEFAKDSDKDSWFLIKMNKLLNNNGLSIGRPVFWLLFINVIFIIFIYTAQFGPENIISLDHLCIIVDNFLNISPLSEIASEKYNNLSQSLDSLRKLLLSGVLFSLASAALRFRYSGK